MKDQILIFVNKRSEILLINYVELHILGIHKLINLKKNVSLWNDKYSWSIHTLCNDLELKGKLENKMIVMQSAS